MNVKTDCFAYEKRKNPDGGCAELCKALTAMYCKNEPCKFYKTAEQACKECTYSDCKGCPNPFAVKL